MCTASAQFEYSLFVSWICTQKYFGLVQNSLNKQKYGSNVDQALLQIWFRFGLMLELKFSFHMPSVLEHYQHWEVTTCIITTAGSRSFLIIYFFLSILQINFIAEIVSFWLWLILERAFLLVLLFLPSLVLCLTNKIFRSMRLRSRVQDWLILFIPKESLRCRLLRFGLACFS